MDLTRLIRHPEVMDKETLYELRSLIALYPYYQTARLLMLQNLYLLHDQSFDEELRRSSIYLTDRGVLFSMMESAHYKIRQDAKSTMKTGTVGDGSESRTVSLIDDFLDAMPINTDDEELKDKKRKPTPADAAVDYVSYLLECESGNDSDEAALIAPEMRGQSLIDNFISNGNGKIKLQDEVEFTPQISESGTEETGEVGEGFFTEALANIYIKQGKYDKALEIIKRLNLNYPKKNAYFADQIRFLEKLIVNNKQ